MRLRIDRRWFALFAVFSLGSLFAIPTVNWIWLTFLTYLTYLAYLVPARPPAVNDPTFERQGEYSRRVVPVLPWSNARPL